MRHALSSDMATLLRTKGQQMSNVAHVSFDCCKADMAPSSLASLIKPTVDELIGS